MVYLFKMLLMTVGATVLGFLLMGFVGDLLATYDKWKERKNVR